MSYGPLLRDCVCKALVFFNIVAAQARLTSRFTPGFSKNLEEKLPDHKRVLFSWLNPSDSGLKAFLVGLSCFLAVVLWVPSFRTVGLPLAFCLSFVGLYSDLKLNESFLPHTIICVSIGAALYVGE
jgi:hypothetical protein